MALIIFIINQIYNEPSSTMQFCEGPRIRLSVCIMQHVDGDFFHMLI